MNIPNILSVFRIALIPFTGFFLCNDRLVLGVILFAVACATDILDGYIARKFNQITDLGRLLDPIADKGMQLTVFVCMAVKSYMPWVGVAVIVLKEILMVGGSASLYKKNVIVQANWYGKISTVITSLCVFIILLFFDSLSLGVRIVLQWLPVVSALIALGKYSGVFIDIRKEKKAS